MMPHCREGAMSVSQTNFHDHFGTRSRLFQNLEMPELHREKAQYPRSFFSQGGTA